MDVFSVVDGYRDSSKSVWVVTKTLLGKVLMLSFVFVSVSCFSFLLVTN